MLGESTFRKLSEIGAKRVMVQIPEGLKTKAYDIYSELRSGGFAPMISVEPCFGACDLRDAEAKELGCDALLHIGHSDFGVKPKLPVVYDDWASDFDPVNVVAAHMGELDGFSSIGLAATVQHVGSLGHAKSFLESKGKRALVGKSGMLREGQVLGCDCSSALSVSGGADCFIYIGGGLFHAEALARSTGKPVFRVNPEDSSFTQIPYDAKKAEIRRLMRIEKARQKKRFAVFLCTKPGQRRAKEAFDTLKALRSSGRDTILITADMLTPEKITGMGIDVIVNTACPRIYDDQKAFGAIILQPGDAAEL